MIKSKFNMRNITLAISLILLLSMYRVLNNGDRGYTFVLTSLDNSIPLVKWFIVPYTSWSIFLYVYLIIMLFTNEKIYAKTVITLDLCLIVCYFTYFFFQTTIDRPQIAGADILSKMVRFTYSGDNPYNCFPSVHCITSIVLLAAVWKSDTKKILKLVTVFIFGMIILSTLFVKQHLIMDAFSAIIIGCFIYNFVEVFDVDKIFIIDKIKKIYSNLFKKKNFET